MKLDLCGQGVRLACAAPHAARHVRGDACITLPCHVQHHMQVRVGSNACARRCLYNLTLPYPFLPSVRKARHAAVRVGAARAHLHLLHVGQLGLHVQHVVDLRLVGGRAGRQAVRRRRRVRQRAAERQVLCAPDLRSTAPGQECGDIAKGSARRQHALACQSTPRQQAAPSCLPNVPRLVLL